MRPGKLRHRVDLLQPTREKDGKGGYSAGFTEIATGVRAFVEALDGREAMVGQIMEGMSSYRIWIRWRGDVGAKWQVKFGAIDLNVTAPPSNPDGRREWLLISASTGAALKTA
ncbi:head-tail adaptor protein [Sphingomonas sp.]|uniref:head-tail adaptor protein n=1 Tax=Sphingomonas sp. TaxID=28214 RepID=UPI003F70269A